MPFHPGIDADRRARENQLGGFRTDRASGYGGAFPQEGALDALTARRKKLDDEFNRRMREAEERAQLNQTFWEEVTKVTTSSSSSSQTSPRTSSRVPKRNESVPGAGIVEGAYERYRSLIEDELQDDIAKLTRSYEDRIADLRDEIGGYQTGVGEINANYGEYTDEANRILGDVADLEAEPLGDSTVDETIAATYDEFGGILSENLNQLSSANPEMAAAMNEELRFMESAIEDGIRSATMSQSEMHRLASVNASALATLVWKDDIFNAERARFQMEVQIEKAISDRQDELADVQRDMARAIQDRRDEQGAFNIDPDDLWNGAMLDFFTGRELDDQQRQDMTRLWEQLMGPDGNPQAMVDFDTFKSSIVSRINEENLRRLGIFDKVTDLRNYIRGLKTDDPLNPLGFDPHELDAKIVAAVNSPNMERDLKQLVALAESSGFGFIVDKWGLDDADWDSLEDINSNKFQSILDLWGVHKQFRTEYNDFIENQNAGYTSGGQAANNYANRNKPEYKYRRETTAPWFASELQRLFPGVEIGGLGYIRPPGDVSSTKAANSDHQSGGAIDVYWKHGTTAEKNAKMAEINAWLRRHGGVSFTNWYDGKSHVHVSFNLGWRIPGRA